MDDLALAQAVYTNYCEMWRAVGAVAPDGSIFEVQQRSDMLLVRSRYTQRIPHMILDPVVDGRTVHDWIAFLVQELAADPISLMVAIPPGQEQSLLVDALRAEGFMPSARPLVAMARVAEPPARDTNLPPAISIASSETELAEARDLLARIFGLPDEVFAFYTPPSLVRTYVLRHHGMLVAAMCLCPFAGYAGVYSVGVLPSARGRGYARHLVRRALQDAARGGLPIAVLSCERNLVGLYQALGFTTCWDLAAYWLEAWWR
ncbi:MAG TPA: GNAT family N-acetyltransferase [Chloroflexota bacterium]|jgi:ribosomal protein S18 acetylase RimI-like enzyme|nr:GNAT family N-acetyltransferase [Chloroflexota bacterium]